jgi:23S rRNA (adenine2503-C2)-methyltransferase
MKIEAVRSLLRAHGAKRCHEDHLLRRWTEALPWLDGRSLRAKDLPDRVRAVLPDLAASLAGLAQLHTEHPGDDGASRLLLRLADGMTVESVLLPRDGLCVSTQVGCAVGCLFCMTGRDGLLRQLGSAEIVAQVVLARALLRARTATSATGAAASPATTPPPFRPVHKVVFMGMGEPAHNLDNVMEAIELLGTAGGIGHKNLVFSTVGDRRVFERLAQGPVKPALALSLHSTRAALREQLLPRAPRIAPAELVALGERYARATGYPVQYQWTLLKGVNDGDDELEGIVALLAGKYAVLNMIPYNAVPGLEFERPQPEQAASIARRLHQRGVLTKLRHSAGQDVDGGCGQLRARTVPAAAGTAPIRPPAWERIQVSAGMPRNDASISG